MFILFAQIEAAQNLQFPLRCMACPAQGLSLSWDKRDLMSMNKAGWCPFCVPLCATWDHKGHRWSSDFLSIWEKVDVIWKETEAVKKSEKKNLKRSARSKAKDRCVGKKGLVDWEQSKDVHWQQGTKKRLMWLAGWKILNSNNTKPDPLPLPSSNPLHLECDLPQQLNTMK